MLELTLIRHAESVVNTRRELIGGRFLDSPLTDRGVEQARALGRRLGASLEPFDEVYVSHATRALQTCEHALEAAGWGIEADVVESIVEISQGSWEGELIVDRYTPEVRAQLKREGWAFCPPEGESMQDVQDRAFGWIERAFASRSEGRVALFTHSMVIRVVLQAMLGSHRATAHLTHVDHTSLTTFGRSHRGWHMLRVNDAAHLPGSHGAPKLVDS